MSASLDMILEMEDRSSREMEQVNRNLKDIKASAAAVSFTVMIEGATRAAQSIGNIVGKASELTKAAAEDEASQIKVKQALENTGASWSNYAGKVDAAITTGAKFGRTDDEIRDSLSLLFAQTGNADEAFRRLTDAQDLAQGAGIDLVTASKLLGKVSDENTSALKRYGVEAKGSVVDQVALRDAQLDLAKAEENQQKLLAQGPSAIKPSADAFRDVQRAQESANLAQTKYNEAVSKNGANSTAARSALVSLHSAQDRLSDAKKKTITVTEGEKASELELAVAQNEVEKAHGKVQEAMKGTATAADVLGAVQQKFGGQADAYSKSSAAQAEAAKIQYDELKETLGSKLLPVQIAVLTQFAALPGSVQLGGAAIATFGGDAVQAMGGLGQLAFGLKGIGPMFTAIGPMASIASKAIMSMGMALLTPPVGIVIALVAAGVAIYLFRDQIVSGLGAGEVLVVGFATKAWDAIKGFGDKVLGFFRDNWREVAPLIAGPFAPLVLLATDGFGIRTALVNGLTSLVSSVAELGVNLVTGLIDGIIEKAKDLPGILKKYVTDIIPDTVKDLLGIHSPSTVMKGLGLEIGKGLALGMLESASKDVNGAADFMVEQVNGVWQRASEGSAGTNHMLASSLYTKLKSSGGGGSSLDSYRVGPTGRDGTRRIYDFRAGGPTGAEALIYKTGQVVPIPKSGWDHEGYTWLVQNGYLPSYAKGSRYIPRDQIARVHEGEEIVTKREARNNRRVGGGKDGITVQFLGPVYGDRQSVGKAGSDVAYAAVHAMRFRGAVS